MENNLKFVISTGDFDDKRFDKEVYLDDILIAELVIQDDEWKVFWYADEDLKLKLDFKVFERIYSEFNKFVLQDSNPSK